MNKTNNRRNVEGNATEKFTAKTFKKNGYWAHIVSKNISGGQPCDVIAARGNKIWLVDAKHVETSKVSFTFDRIEPNQISSMAYAANYAKIDSDRIGFSIYFDRTKKLYWFAYTDYVRLHTLGAKSVNIQELNEFEEVIK